jgi:malate dehydrogenase
MQDVAIDVAIIGAGELGGAIAHRLAKAGVVSTICLVDETGSIAAGKALDIMQAAPIERFATRVMGATDIAAADDASIIVIADRAALGNEDGLLLLTRLGGSAAKSLILCAGAGHRELIERGAREVGVSRTRLFGSAPEALASAIRSIVATESGGSPLDVALTVLGIPPTHTVVPWEDATIGGLSAVRVLDTPARRRIEANIAQGAGIWPPGPHALAAAAVKAINIVMGGSRQTMNCFVAPDDSAGRRTRAAAFPTRLGREGIVQVDVPPLTTRDHVALDNAIML